MATYEKIEEYFEDQNYERYFTLYGVHEEEVAWNNWKTHARSSWAKS